MFLKKNNQIKTIIVAVLFAFIVNFINIPVSATEINNDDVTISISKDKVKSNETIEVTLKNGSKDGWVGLYSDDLVIGTNPSIWWKYVTELGNKDGSGSFNLNLTGIVDEGGKYKLVLFKDSKYIIEAEVEFEVEAVEVPEGMGHLELKTSAGVMPNLPEKIQINSEEGIAEEVSVKWDEVDSAKYAKAGAFTVYGTVEGIEEKAKANVTVIEGNGPLFSFEVFSDTHITKNLESTSSKNLDKALKEIKEINEANESNSIGLMINGDVTDSGLKYEWDLYNEILENNNISTSEIYETYGNHDTWGPTFQQSLDFFYEYTKTEKVYFDKWINDYHFIFLGSEKSNGNSAWLSETQLKWFEEKLAEGAEDGKPVFVFLHQGLVDTAAGTKAYQGWHGVTQDKEMKEIIKKYPQVMMFSGHSHWELKSKDTVYNDTYATFVNTGSTSYLWNDADEHIYRSEGWLLDVYEDKIVLKGRDFTNEVWVEEAQYTVNYPEDMPENDLEKPTWDASSKLNAKKVSAFDVVLNWDKDSVKDNIGVTKFNIYKDEELVATVDADTTELKVEGLEENTEYKFTVQAVDGLENISIDGPSITVKTEKYLLKKIDQSLMNVTATSEENKLANNKAINVLDGNVDTIWHSSWNNTSNPLPQSITLELDNVYNVGALKYTPRKSGSNGIIKKYKVYTSIDGEEYTEVASGNWEANNKEKLVEFDAVEAKFIKLEALEGQGNYASAAELNVFVEDADMLAAQEVIKLIDELSNDIKLEDKEDVVAARNAYEALTEAQKTLVSNLEKLEKAEAKISELEKDEDQDNNEDQDDDKEEDNDADNDEDDKKDEVVSKPEENNKPNNKPNNNLEEKDELPKTGGVNSNILIIFAIISLIGGAVVLTRKQISKN